MSNTLLVRIWTFYRDGFREMTLGRNHIFKLTKKITSYDVIF